MRGLTRRQAALLSAIQEYIGRYGYPPTIRELQRACGLRSTSTVHLHLEALHRKGYLERVPGTPRAMRVVQRG